MGYYLMKLPAKLLQISFKRVDIYRSDIRNLLDLYSWNNGIYVPVNTRSKNYL